MLERADEVKQLDDALASARRGVGSVVLLEGAPGIGKSALLAYTRVRAGAGASHHAQASPLEQAFDFAIVRQLLEARLVAAPDDEREALLAGPARLAAALFDPSAPPAPEAGEYELLQGLYWLCANLAGDDVLLLTIDDAQWADAASLRFVHYLLGRLGHLPALVVLARCTGEPSAHPELLATIAAAPVTRVLQPQPLSLAAVQQLVAAMRDGDGAAPDPAAFHAASGGNPFLLRALLDALATGEDPAAAGPPAVAVDQLPRLERCSPDGVALAQAFAVLGPGAQLRDAAALAGLKEPAAFEAAGALADHGVLRADGGWRFEHPIVGNAIYASVATADRAHAHAHAVELLAGNGTPAEPLARHLVHASPETAPRPESLAVLRDAASAALGDRRPADAAAYLRRALAEPATGERTDLLVELGRAELRLSHPVEACRHFGDALADLDDDGRRAEVGLELARALVMAGRCRMAVRVLDDLVAELREAGRDVHRLEAELTAARPVGDRTGPPVAARPGAERGDDANPATGTLVLLANASLEAATAGRAACEAALWARDALAAAPCSRRRAASRCTRTALPGRSRSATSSTRLTRR